MLTWIALVVFSVVLIWVIKDVLFFDENTTKNTKKNKELKNTECVEDNIWKITLRMVAQVTKGNIKNNRVLNGAEKFNEPNFVCSCKKIYEKDFCNYINDL